MKNYFKKAAAIAVAAIMLFCPVVISAIDYNVPEGASTMNARFNVMDTDTPNVEFSMLSEDGELVIHINEETLIYFEDFILVRDVLEEGQTLAEVLDGRNLVVTYAVTTRSLPPQTSPISVKVMYEGIMPLPGAADIGLPFDDVDVNDWFFNPVVWAFENEIMNGVSGTKFAPEADMTRGMLVTVLWRYAGKPESGEVTFADAEKDAWYSGAVAWAAENDIVTGYNETTFGVNDHINREQMYTILYRYMNFAELSITLDEEMRVRFADVEEISDWAAEAMHFMYDAGVMFTLSTTDNNAKPKENAFRGEIAGAMYFFDKYAVNP